MKTINEVQKYFNIDLLELSQKKESEINEYIEQTHFGDMLLEVYEHKNERYKLYFSLDENVQLGEKRVQIEYSGKESNYNWITIFKF